MIKLINELQLTENDHSTAPTGTFNRVKMILRQQELEPEWNKTPPPPTHYLNGKRR